MIKILEKICASVEKRTAETEAQVPWEELVARRSKMRVPQDFAAVFLRPGLNVIAEVKLASPSEGAISSLDPVEIAGQYIENGAVALSVLTEQDHFAGHPDNLKRIREKYSKFPLLMKDFILSPYQIAAARDLGADCILLILACLGEEKTGKLMQVAEEWGLSTLIEVHDQYELSQALALDARLIGINNRNLKTMEVDTQTSRNLAENVPSGVTLISESGLKTPQDLRELQQIGFGGFLIGTSLMKTGEPGQALARLIGPETH